MAIDDDYYESDSSDTHSTSSSDSEESLDKPFIKPIKEDTDSESSEDDMMGGADEDYDTDNKGMNVQKKTTFIEPENMQEYISDDEEDENENFLQKFDAEINRNYIKEQHTECIVHNYQEVNALTFVVRDKNNIIIDPLHKTIPYLTKYERTRVLGQRSKQIEYGDKPFVKIPENVIDGYVIAEMELNAKAIPFIIKRPLPNGSCEYWKLKDLEVISF